MVATILLLATMTAVDGSVSHVRSRVPRIAELVERGIAGSQTFRALVTTLDRSDVIVYLEPKQARSALGGFLSHRIVSVAGTRYLRIYVETQGLEQRVIALIGHELQHAVEVAQAQDARDSESLERLFTRLAVAFGCDAAACFETQAAKDVERKVRREVHDSLTGA